MWVRGNGETWERGDGEMMERLLALLREGGTWRVSDLARALDTTPALVQVMLDDLARKGLLQQVGATCNKGCAGCALSGRCNP
jgi:predicted ArsR family transcriptional regulator